ncbi:XrtA system polysaccharide chain length determinant [Elioraea sp.]|uniref:XrtA system polysaccharide chain length determinant n=1 Tax=Elioraea sp. TaxID=2185103 RepID=UPI0025BB2B63|nr:XrtA system polysaccharide chain length determinant [Elioraea sp.]
MNLNALARRYAAAGWRHRWKALLLAWLICLPGWAAVYLMPNQFKANARVYADPEALLGTLLRGLAVNSSPATQVDMLQRTLLSRPNLERVIAKTDLDLRVFDAASRESLLNGLAKSIRIIPQTRQLFQIEYTDSDPRLAYSVVQTVVALFLESAATSDRQQMRSASNFLNQQIGAYEVQLREAEQRRAEFMVRYVDILPSAQLGGASKLEQARQKVIDLRGQMQDATLRREVLRQQLDATPQTMAEVQGVTGGGNPRLAEAERQLRELRLSLTDQHPAVVAQRAIIAEIRAGGGGSAAPAPRQPSGTQRGGLPNPIYEQLRIRLVDQDGVVASLERQLRDETADVERLERLSRAAPHVAAEMQNIDRDYGIIRKNYEELLGRRESLQLADAARNESDRMRIEVVEPPLLPTVPVGPNRVLFSAGVLVAGLGAGAVLVFLLIQLDRGFYTTHDLRTLGLPVLGGISSALAPKRQVAAAIVFVGGIALLLVTFGAVLAGGPTLVARLPALVAKLVT